MVQNIRGLHLFPFNPPNGSMIWTVVAVVFVASDVSHGYSLRQLQTQPVDGPGCDSKSISTIIPVWSLDSFKRKTFSGCTIRSGEVAVITNRMNVGVDVSCAEKQISEPEEKQQQISPSGGLTHSPVLEAKNVQPNHSFVMNVYVDIESIMGPWWHCRVKRSEPGYEEVLLFNAFSDYRQRESFNFEVTSSGLYVRDPRLTERWKIPRPT